MTKRKDGDMTETTMRAPGLLRAVFVVHGLITLVGGVVLTGVPDRDSSAVGITITRPDYLLVYLVAAAELAVAVLSFGATRLTDPAALRLIVTTFVVFHGASGILDLLYMAVTRGEQHDNREHRASVHRGRGVPRRVASGAPSPHVGHQPVVHLLHVVAVSGQFLCQQRALRR